MEKFVFFGTSNNSISVLKTLIDNGYLCASAITVPDKPVGRKQILSPSPVKLFAQKNNIPVVSISSKEELLNLNFQLTIHNYQFGLVADYGLLIPANIIKLFPKGILNIHPSLLPAYQGATPVPFQILRGEKEGGVTIITINEKFDEGKIIAQEKFPIVESETTNSLLTKGFSKGAKLLINVLADYLSGKIIPIPQDLSKKSYFPRLSRDDSFIEWTIIKKTMEGLEIKESEKPKFIEIGKLSIINYQFSIERLLRAFTPWPGVWTVININNTPKRLKLLKSHIEKDRFVLDMVQLEGKNPVLWSQFIKAYQILN